MINVMNFFGRGSADFFRNFRPVPAAGLSCFFNFKIPLFTSGF